MSLDQLKYAAQSVANEFGESQSTINDWISIYEEQTGKVASYGTEMENLKVKMNSLESELNIATQALERMAAAAQTASASFPVSVNMSSGAYYNWYYSTHSHKDGLEYVPYDGYQAILHKGERIETAAEANLRRQYGIQQPGLDYGTLGSAMWQNAPKMGGDVYLDGRIVGQVLSQAQGRSYRQLQRSGWQG